MIICKNPFDSSIAAIKAVKEALSGVKRITLFVFDVNLQYRIATSQGKTNNTKDVAFLGVYNDTVLAVFDKEEEQCTICFREVKEGYSVVNTSKLISIPILRDEILICSLQVENDCEE